MEERGKYWGFFIEKGKNPNIVQGKLCALDKGAS